MALLKLSGIVTQISGKIGGSILGTSGNGSYIKQNSYSQQHATPAQSLQRTKIGLFTQEWRNTTISQRENWASEVVNYPYTNRVGDTVYYNAYQLFCSLNSNLLLINENILLNPATYEAIFEIDLDINTLTTSSIEIELTNVGLNDAFVVYASKPVQQGRKVETKNMRIVYISKTGVDPQLPDIITEYTSIFGVPIVGQLIYFNVKGINMNTGNSLLTNQIKVGLVV